MNMIGWRTVVFYGAASGPGWHDILALLLTGAGFWIAITQIKSAKEQSKLAKDQSKLAKEQSEKAALESSKATKALAEAHRHLSQRALMAVLPQIQTIVTDLAFAFPTNNVEVAQRTLVSHRNREERGGADSGGPRLGVTPHR
jgi:hypothetical protein